MPNKNLKLADEFAEDYDRSVLKNNWIGPETIFNLVQHYLTPKSKILDLGIGTGESSLRFQNSGHKITGVDGSTKMLEQCKKKNIGKKLILHNLEEFPFPIKKQHFNAVISNGVFHLIYPLKPVFTEVKNALKPKGLFAFTFEKSEDISGHSEVESGVWEMKTKTGVQTYKHSEHYISELLKQNGFQIEKQKQFLAYMNSELQKQFYFTAIVARLQRV